MVNYERQHDAFEDFIKQFTVALQDSPSAFDDNVYDDAVYACFHRKTILQFATRIADSTLLTFFQDYQKSFDKKQFIELHFNSTLKEIESYGDFFRGGYLLAVKGIDFLYVDLISSIYNSITNLTLNADKTIYYAIKKSYDYVLGYSTCIAIAEIKRFANDNGHNVNFDIPINTLTRKNPTMKKKHIGVNPIPKVFITYSWDDNEHKEWVLQLANKLFEKGVDVLLDRYEIRLGDSITQFMEKSVVDSDKVIVILTPNYRTKSLERQGGVGYEQQIISGEIMSGIPRNKFIPVLRKGSLEAGIDCAIPPHFSGIALIDLTMDDHFDKQFDELLRNIHQEPKLVKPQIGAKPNFL